MSIFSEEKGRATALLKNNSKRKRTKSEIEEVKEEESNLKENKQEFLQNIKRLKKELKDKEVQTMIYQEDHNIVEKLLDANQIDVYGNPMNGMNTIHNIDSGME